MSNLEELQKLVSDLVDKINTIDPSTMLSGEVQAYLNLADPVIKALQDVAIKWSDTNRSKYEDNSDYQLVYDYENGELDEDELPETVDLEGKVYRKSDYFQLMEEIYELISFNGAGWGYRSEPDSWGDWGKPEWQWTGGWASSYC